MQPQTFPWLQQHLGRLVDSWYNGRAGQSISFDPISNPYAAAFALYTSRRATSSDGTIDLARARRSGVGSAQLRAA